MNLSLDARLFVAFFSVLLLGVGGCKESGSVVLKKGGSVVSKKGGSVVYIGEGDGLCHSRYEIRGKLKRIQEHSYSWVNRAWFPT